MLTRLIGSVASTVGRHAHRVGESIKPALRPARTAAMLAGAAGLDALRPRSGLMAENALLRQQILVLRRAAPPRPRLYREDRLLLVLLARLTSAWRDGLHLVQPATLLRWHRDLFTILWRRKSGRKHRPIRLRADVIDLIRTMARANRGWGAERIRGELLKVGIRVSKRTIQKYMRTARPRGDRRQTWEVFLRTTRLTSGRAISSNSMTPGSVPSSPSSSCGKASREIVHVNVTRFPTDFWVAQQLREATPYDYAPRFLIRDNDGKFGSHFAAAADGAGIDVVTIPPRPPT